MRLKKALKSDFTVIFDMLNYNKSDISISCDDFKKIYIKNYHEYNLVIYENIRIGVVYDKKVFIHPSYWERIDYKQVDSLMDTLR